MATIGSATTSAAALQAADRTSDKALTAASKKLANDRKANAGQDVIRADQAALTSATKTATSIDAKLSATSSSGGAAPGGAQTLDVKA